LERITFSVSAGSIYAFWLKRISGQKSSGLQTMFATVQTGLRRVAEKHYWSAGV
jgi:hypothetical protein